MAATVVYDPPIDPGTEKLVNNTRPVLLATLKVFERQFAHRGKVNAVLGVPAHPDTAIATQDQSDTSSAIVQIATSTKKLPKSQRRARLRRLRETSDVQEARRLTSDILTEWNGCGLHVFEAIKILAAFPSETISAVEMLFAALEKLAQLWAKEQDTQKIWRQLNRDSGRAGRYIKSADRTLTQIICRHWNLKFKASQVDTFDWSSVMLRSLRIFSMFSGHLAAPTDKSTFDGPNQILLPSAGVALRSVHEVQYSRMIVLKVAGQDLPQELIDMILDRVSSHSVGFKVVVGIAGNYGSQFRCRIGKRIATTADQTM
ncbi:hypothetical protein CB0940_02639 [Cercospora beticola]|uniref:Uncharacterized protein n=1 Tax=Cercospora beticola TaxID=122368 RepID=A0A2G5I1L8_CERBT|nr:hypothetical protein CB0940_02639 [Cercospora beticola]PIA98695.1 hypothetical protein CB0940_02639 [Cercospora beticola]WPA99785.1 hypothetical protein RHO25_004404 [Cercospora beticola]CAK1362059.1 unnamed protein product [Cercospora beticola]